MLYKQIKKGQFDFPDPYWSEISAEAKDLVNKLLCVDPKARFTAQQVLQHPVSHRVERETKDCEQ